MSYSYSLKEIPFDFLEDVWGLPLTKLQKEVFFRRGFKNRYDIFDFITPPLFSPKRLKDADLAAERIALALKNGDSIVIYADYDVDGITSASILYAFFHIYFFSKNQESLVSVIFPNRITSGYGLKRESFPEIEKYNTKLLILLDNGMSSHDAINYATEVGIDVIIIDHHTVPEIPPPAYSIINPKQKDCLYPFKKMCTAGLVYKFLHVLGEKILAENILERFLERFIDYVAIGTYQDLVDLEGENRFLVKKGLQKLNSLKKRPETNIVGILELLKQQPFIRDCLKEDILGYYLGPIINSAGRIGNPYTAFKLLTTTDKREATEIAKELYLLNQERKDLTLQAVQSAEKQIEGNEKKTIILVSEVWHPGIIGLVAQRISQKAQNKFVIVMTKSQNNTYVASCRTTLGNNIMSLLRGVKNLLLYYGGHEQAAGFSIDVKNIDAFKNECPKIAASLDESLEKVIDVDLSISLEVLKTNKFYEEISLFEPYGKGNAPIRVCILGVLIAKISLSKRKLDTLFSFKQGLAILNAVAFNSTSYMDWVKKGMSVDIILKVSGTFDSPEIQLLDLREAV